MDWVEGFSGTKPGIYQGAVWALTDVCGVGLAGRAGAVTD
jgi:hypothetical protein